MQITVNCNNGKILHLTNREFEVIRLLICIGCVMTKGDRDADPETREIAERLNREILSDSVSKTEGG